MFDLTPFNYRPSSIFKAFDEFEKNFFRGFNTDFGNFRDFRTDIIEKDDKYILSAELPGFNKEDINVDINDNMLTISAEHREENDEKDSKGNYIRRERTYGSYTRSFDISNVKVDDIKAEYKNGILELELPKLEEKPVSQRRIEIK